MSPIEQNQQEKIYHGKVIGDFIELHRYAYIERRDDNDIYKPLMSIVNPKYILSIDTINNFDGCKIYFTTKQSDLYYESIEEVERLLAECYEKSYPKNISSKLCMPKCN